MDKYQTSRIRNTAIFLLSCLICQIRSRPKPVPVLGTFLLMRAGLEILYRSVVLKCPSQACLGTLGPEEIHFYTSLPSEMQTN
jgi:hypothetical protein